MASMVVNHFKMRSDIQSYHLGGMGCANGVVAINMVKDLLEVKLQRSPRFRAACIFNLVAFPRKIRCETPFI